MNDPPNPQRYKGMHYNRVGRSGLLLAALSLGLWHNFGKDDNPEAIKTPQFSEDELGQINQILNQ